MQCTCGEGCSQKVTGDRAKLVEICRQRLVDMQLLSPSVVVEEFICPLCARVQSDTCIVRAHYPAEMAGGATVTALCHRCNSVLGGKYEGPAKKYIDQSRGLFHAVIDTRAGTQPMATPRTTVKVLIEADGSVIFVDTGKGANSVRARNHILPSSQIRLCITPTTDTAKHRAMLSWSFLHWFDLAGYQYAFSPGARTVANMLLDGRFETGLEWSLYEANYDPERELGQPEPVIVYACGDNSGDTLLALGSKWVGVTTMLPTSDDASASCFRQLSAWAQDGHHVEQPFHFVPLADLFPKSAASNFADGAITLDDRRLVGVTNREGLAAMGKLP